MNDIWSSGLTRSNLTSSKIMAGCGRNIILTCQKNLHMLCLSVCVCLSETLWLCCGLIITKLQSYERNFFNTAAILNKKIVIKKSEISLCLWNMPCSCIVQVHVNVYVNPRTSKKNVFYKLCIFNNMRIYPF